MNKKLLIRIIAILVLFILLAMPSIYAIDKVFSDGDAFIKDGEKQTSPINKGNLQKISDTIYNVLLSVAVVIAVIVGAILGVQFMWGSMEEQAKIKESLMPFVIGCIIVFGAFGIWKLATIIFQSV